MALTTEQIHGTADELVTQGVKPTLAKVREALGGGSFTTISEAMQTWREDRQEEQQLQQVDLPTSITERLQVLGADIWQTAIDIANDRLTKEREALAIAQDEAQAQVDEAKEAVKTLELEQAELLTQLDDLTTEAENAKAEAKRSNEVLDAVNKTLTEVRHDLDLERNNVKALQANRKELNDKLEQRNSELTGARESIATYKATDKAQLAEIERLQAELLKFKSVHEVKVKELEERTGQRDKANELLATCKGKVEVIAEQNSQLLTDREALNQKNNELVANVIRLESDKEQLSTMNDELVAKVKVLQGKLDKKS